MGRRIIGKILLPLLAALLFTGCPEGINQADIKEDIKDRVDYATAQEYQLRIVVPENSILSGPEEMRIKEGYKVDIGITAMNGYGFLGWEQTDGSGTVIFENDDPMKASTKITIKGGSVELTPIIDARPSIHYFTPFGTDIPLNAQFNVVMSEAIDPTTLTDKTVYIQELTSGEKVDGYIQYENGVIKLQPIENLKPFMPYTIYLSDEITDVQGLTLGSSLTTDQFRSGKEIDEGGAPPPEVIVNPALISRTYNNLSVGGEVTVYYTNSTNIELSSVRATDTNGPAGAIKVEVPTGNGTEVMTNYYQYKEYGQPLSITISDIPGAHRVKLYTIDPAGNEFNSDGVTPIEATELIFVYENSYNAFQGGIGATRPTDILANKITKDGILYCKTSDFTFSISPETRIVSDGTYWLENIQDSNELYLASMPSAYRLSTSSDMSSGEWSTADNAYNESSSWISLDADALHSAIINVGSTAFFEKSFNIGSRDGRRSVYVQFKNELGFESIPVEYDLIQLDNEAPSVTASLKNASDFVSTANVDLLLNIHDLGVGDSTFSIKDIKTPITDQTYDPLTPETTIELVSGDGVKSVRISAKDGLGNATTDDVILNVTYDETAPSAGTIKLTNLEGTEEETTTTEIIAHFSGLTDALSGVDQIGLRNAIETEITWYPVAESYNWVLPTGNDRKTVFMSLKDKAGNSRIDVASDEITLNIPPPKNSFTINNGNELTNDPKLDIRLAFDSAAPMFKCWEAGTTEPGWTEMDVSKEATISLTVSAGDGLKTINVKYADLGDPIGTALPLIQKTITLDTTAPSLSNLIIKGKDAIDDGYTNTTIVAINATIAGATGFRFVINNGTTSEYTGWQSVDETATSLEVAEFKIPENIVALGLQVRDKAENISEDSRNIIIDQKLPLIGIVLKDKDLTNGHETKLTNSRDILIEVNYKDNTLAKNMRFSNDGTSWSNWMPVAKTVNWALPAAALDGEHPVYYQIRDAAGNVSAATAFKTIALDTTAPEIATMVLNYGEDYTPAIKPIIALDAKDDNGIYEVFEQSGAGAVTSRPYNNISKFQAASEIANQSHQALNTYTVYVTDFAGNKSASASDSITYVEPNPTKVTKGNSLQISLIFEIIKKTEITPWANYTTYNVYASKNNERPSTPIAVMTPGEGGHTSFFDKIGEEELIPGQLYYFWIQAKFDDFGGTGRAIPMGFGYKSDITIVFDDAIDKSRLASLAMERILTAPNIDALNSILNYEKDGNKLELHIQRGLRATPYSVTRLPIQLMEPEQIPANKLDSKIVLLSPNIKIDDENLYTNLLINMIHDEQNTLFFTSGYSGMFAFNLLTKAAELNRITFGPGVLNTDIYGATTLTPFNSHFVHQLPLILPYRYLDILNPDTKQYFNSDVDACIAHANKFDAIPHVYLRLIVLGSKKLGLPDVQAPLLSRNGRYAHLAIDGTNDSVIVAQVLNIINLTINMEDPESSK